jgi:hypothetical protein
MARKKIKRKKQQPGVPDPEWARFLTGYHGRGAHRDLSKYQRHPKHKQRKNSDE